MSEVTFNPLKENDSDLIQSDDDIIVIDDYVDNSEDLSTKTLQNVDVLTDAIGHMNYNIIIDALCTLRDVKTKSRAFTALFSCGKVVQSRKIQTDITINEDEGSIDTNNVQDDSTIISQLDESLHLNAPEENLPRNSAKSIITGEGELNLDQCQSSFILKGDGRRTSVEED